jgi:hypothetical protein
MNPMLDVSNLGMTRVALGRISTQVQSNCSVLKSHAVTNYSHFVALENINGTAWMDLQLRQAVAFWCLVVAFRRPISSDSQNRALNSNGQS